MEKKDKFIQIAMGGKRSDGEIKRLEEIAPLSFEHKNLIETTKIATSSKIKTQSELYKEFCAEKEKLKEYYLPFLSFVPKKVKSDNKLLSDFYYRKETEEDKKDFLSVLNGKGKWEKVKVPHYDGPDGKWNCFYYTDLDINILEDKIYTLRFDAVDYVAEVYVNNRMVKTHVGFFAPFEVDITEYIKNGLNRLLVVVKNDLTSTGVDINGFTHYGDKIYGATNIGYDEPKLGWHHCPAGAGIFGKVSLITTNKQRITDIFVMPNIDSGNIKVKTTIYNYVYGNANVDVFYTLEGRNFNKLVFKDVKGDCDILQAQSNFLEQEFTIPDFVLWTLDKPYLYELTITIKDSNGDIVDQNQTHFGMRKFSIDENSLPKGKFYFNNQRIMLRGTNEMGHLPRAIMEDDYDQLIEDILIAKIAGLNFYRMTQRPVFDEIYTYFDMLGMLCQSDFPLFSYMKYTSLGDAIKQVDEMELMTRNHPSVVLESLCNETLDRTAWGKEQYVMGRKEIENFFDAAKSIIKLDNPDRVIKYCEGDYAPLPDSYGVTDFHCYTYWYISHGLPSGKMRKGYLPPIKKDWMTSCGEFGVDGLDRFELMQKYCPKDWLPKDEFENWSPIKIAKEQCYVLHGNFFLEEDNANGWISASRKWQEKAIKDYVDLLRFRSDYIQSTAVHLLIDAWPCGWTKTLVDVDRIPKPAFYAFKTANMPVRGYLRRDKYRVYNTDNAIVEVYCFNDLAKDVIVNGTATVYFNNEVYKSFAVEGLANAVSTTYLGDIALDFDKKFTGEAKVVLELNADGFVSCEEVNIFVENLNKKAVLMPIVKTDKIKNISSICEEKIDENIIFVDSKYYQENQHDIENKILHGAKVFVYMDTPINVFGEDIIFRVNTLEEEVAANNFVVRNKDSVYTKEFADYDFMNFYCKEKDYQDLTAWFKFDWKDSKEVLYTFEYSQDKKYALHKKHKSIVAYKEFGKGKLFLSTLSCLNGCVGVNPILDKFIINIIEN